MSRGRGWGETCILCLCTFKVTLICLVLAVMVNNYFGSGPEGGGGGGVAAN